MILPLRYLSLFITITGPPSVICLKLLRWYAKKMCYFLKLCSTLMSYAVISIIMNGMINYYIAILTILLWPLIFQGFDSVMAYLPEMYQEHPSLSCILGGRHKGMRAITPTRSFPPPWIQVYNIMSLTTCPVLYPWNETRGMRSITPTRSFSFLRI